MFTGCRVAVALALLCAGASAGAAQEPEVEGSPPERSSAIDGPPAPVFPATISRDENGDATVRAIRLSAPLDVDGSLDEAVYTENEPFGDLIQTVPATGQPASERTELWLMFDDRN